MRTLLVTGGAGYIGSHTVVKLLEAGSRVVVLDNFSNSSPQVIDRIETITGARPTFINVDIRNGEALKSAFETYPIDAVIHFAGLKAVGESMSDPLAYFSNNVAGSITLFEEMERAGVRKLVFSSTAAVYAGSGSSCCTEESELAPSSVYGNTKLIVENILRHLRATKPEWRVALLRYFNPIGAHASGLIGEDPRGIPNNLLPFVSQVAVGRRPQLSVFGDDYPTPDGTARRDFIHVDDLAAGHIAAIERLNNHNELFTVNLGTGQPYSVLDVVKAFEQASGRRIPYVIAERRQGDIAEYFADVSKAKELLDWESLHGLERMCEDTWRWQFKNPQGYGRAADADCSNTNLCCG